METARTVAIDLVARGYHPVPLIYKTKKPYHRSWQQHLYGLDDIDEQFVEGDNDNIGILLGTEVQPGKYLYAIDIDFKDQTIIDRVWNAMGRGKIPGKTGQKGITFFGWMGVQAKKQLYVRRDEAKRVVGQIEVLGYGQQTVLPPSIHPDTLEPYRWVEDYGPPLHKTPIGDLPFITPAMLDEIKVAAIEPDSKLFEINEMVWNGPSGGGNVHDTILAATGLLVERQWSSQSIIERLKRAASYMLDGNPHAKHWDWDIFTQVLTKQIDGALAKGFDSNSKRGKRKAASRADMQNMATDALIADFGGSDNVGVIDGAFRVYADGWWKEWNEDSLLRRVIQHPDNWSWMTKNDAVNVVAKAFLAASHLRRKSNTLVMTPKGTLNMVTGELVDPDKESLLTFVLPIDYDPNAKCPTYEKFIEQLFTVDDTSDEDRAAAIQCFEEYCGLTFIQDTSFQKSLIIEGPTGTGKSTILKVVESMHDPSSRTNLDLFDLQSERTTSSLAGKTVSFTFEVGQEEFVSATVFKQVADGSTLSLRKLYAEKFDAPMTARMMIACNTMFKFRDSSGAMERRMLLLKSRQTIPDDLRDRDLENKLRAEIPGIFNRFMVALKKLRERGRFDPPRYMHGALETIAEASDPVLRWIRDRTYEGMAQVDPSFKVPPHLEGEQSSILYADFKEWADLHGHKPLNDVNWGERCTKRGYPSKTKRLPGAVIRIRKLNLINRGKL